MNETNAPLTPPNMGSLYLNSHALEWESTELEGFWVKKLYENPDNGEKTWLMKMDPGAYCGPHTHDEFEQIYVLQGSMEDHNGTIKAGEFVCRAPGDSHTATTSDGALVLLFFSRYR